MKAQLVKDFKTRQTGSEFYLRKFTPAAVREMDEMPPGLRQGDKLGDLLSSTPETVTIRSHWATTEFIAPIGKQVGDSA